MTSVPNMFTRTLVVGVPVADVEAMIDTAVEAALSPALITQSSAYDTTTTNTVTAATIMLPGAVWTVNGVTLTIDAPFSASGTQAFNCINGGKVVFTPGSVSQIDARWWGLQSASLTDAVQSSAQQTINTQAIQAAVNSAQIGTGALAPADIYPGAPGRVDLNACITIPYNFVRIIGPGQTLLALNFTHGGAMFAIGSLSNSSPTDNNAITGLTLQRATLSAVSQSQYDTIGFARTSSRTVTTTTPPTVTALQSLPIGIIAMGATNLLLRDLRVLDCLFKLYQRFTSGTSGGETLDVHTLAGSTTDIRAGVYLDCRGTWTGGSCNGDWGLDHDWQLRGSFAGELYHVIVDARPSTAGTGDSRDIWLHNPESTLCDYGLLAMGGNPTDFEVINPKWDNCRNHGAYLYGLGLGTEMTWSKGHINGTSTLAHGIFVESCLGSIDIDKVKIDGGPSYATSVGIATFGTCSGLKVSASFLNVNYGCVAQSGTTGCHFGPFNASSYSGQGPVSVMQLQPGATNNWVDMITNNATCSAAVIRDAGTANAMLRPKTGASGAQTVPVDGTGSTNNVTITT